jgi:hypothetical protein
MLRVMRGRVSVVIRRASYANVMSTLAVFIALGGVGYAATTLPSGSVATAQLRDGSVTLPKLAFPLGVTTTSAHHPLTLQAFGCPPGAPCPAGAPAQLVTSVELTLKRSARVLLLGSADVAGANGTNGAPASVELDLSGAGTTQTVASGSVAASSSTTLSFQRVVALAPGRHAIGLEGSAEGTTATPTSVEIYPAQLIALLLPQTS